MDDLRFPPVGTLAMEAFGNAVNVTVAGHVLSRLLATTDNRRISAPTFRIKVNSRRKFFA
jgi:hypothetical protein